MKQLLLILFCFSVLITFGQTDSAHSTQKQFIRSYTAGVQHGFIFAHSEAVQNTKGANPTGVELILGWQRNDAEVWNLCNCFPRKGLLLAFYSYDNAVLGKSITAAYFLEPSYRLANNFFFSFRAAGGLSYLTNPFDSMHNPTNMSYSTRISGYLLLGLGFTIKLNNKWYLNPTINYQHISNGGTRQPNKGINWPTAGLALSYQKDAGEYYKGTRKNDQSWRNRPLRFDGILLGNARRSLDITGKSKRVPLLGAGFQVAKAIGRINNGTATIEIYRDASTARMLKRDSIDASAVRAGFSIGHEFLLGRFIFNQRIGTYLFDQTPYNDRIFHRWGLQYMFSNKWSVGFNLQAHRHVAEFIDFRLVYSWQY